MRFLYLVPVLVLVMVAPAPAEDWFSDDFNDGIIDASHWQSAGDITESGGTMNLDRDDPGDYLRTISTYAGDYIIDLDIRLNVVHWNDMFHGIAILDGTGSVGAGISFGFSRYGKLYLAVHRSDGTGASYYYGADGSNQTGTWQHWTLEKQGTDILISVDGNPIPWGPPAGTAYVPDGAWVHLPGDYTDGDGGAHVGVTSSDVDAFSIMPDIPTSVAKGAGVEAGTWGRLKDLYR